MLQPRRDALVGPALVFGDVNEARSKTPREQLASDAADAHDYEEAWRSVPVWRPLKRYRVFYETRSSDALFRSKSSFEQWAEFLNDLVLGAGQPIADSAMKGLQAIEEEAFLLPKQQARGRLTVVIDYRCLMQFYYDDQLGLITRKRAGADLFVERVAQHCDLVFVCDRTRTEIEQFMWRIDPLSRFSVRLYRQALYYKGNKLFKPMHKFGRNMARVLVIDQSLLVSHEYVDNCIVLKPWGAFGVENTLDLVNLMPFIQQMAKNTDDVRDQVRRFRKDKVYIPFFYHKVRELSHLLDMKKQNPTATNLVNANLTPEFWDSGTMPMVEPWDDEPDSMIPASRGGFRTRRDKDKVSLRKAAELLEGTYDPQADGLSVTREELLARIRENPRFSPERVSRLMRLDDDSDDDDDDDDLPPSKF
jgi:hypothetical protein